MIYTKLAKTHRNNQKDYIYKKYTVNSYHTVSYILYLLIYMQVYNICIYLIINNILYFWNIFYSIYII